MPSGVYRREMPLPPDALLVWVFITNFVEKWGYPPTYREIGKSCFMGMSTIVSHLHRLELAGHIERIDGAARGITLLEKPPKHIKKPD